MKITKIIAAASVSCALLAGPAFAQSSATKAEDYAKDKAVKQTKDATKEMASDAAEEMSTSPDTSMIKGDPVTIETPANTITATAAEIAVEDGSITTINGDNITSLNKSPEPGLSDGAVMIKGDPLTIETPTSVITATDAELTMDGDVTTIEADNITTMEKTKSPEPMKSELIDIKIPESEMMDTAPAAVPNVVCPSGTTAQADGTCMITGNFPG